MDELYLQYKILYDFQEESNNSNEKFEDFSIERSNASRLTSN